MKKIERFMLEFLKEIIENGERHPYVDDRSCVSINKIHQGISSCNVEELKELSEYFKVGYSSVSNMFLMQMIDGISLQPLYVLLEAQSSFLRFEGITLGINLALDSKHYSLNCNDDIIQRFLLEKVKNVCGVDVSELKDCSLHQWATGEMEKYIALLYGISFRKDIFPNNVARILKIDTSI